MTRQRLVAHGHYSQPLGSNTTLDATLWGQGVRSNVFLNIPEDGEVSQTDEEDRRVGVGGQAVVTRAGERIRYTTPEADGAEYVAICRPAYSPDGAGREQA